MDAATFLIIRGFVGVTLGFLAMVWPGITIAALVIIFAMYAVLDGVMNVVLGFGRAQERSWVQLLQGIVGIAAGILTFVWPGITALALVLFIGAWATATGVFEVVAAVRLRKVIKGEWLLGLSGVLSLIFGLLVFAFPAAGAVGVAWTLGIYAAATGFVLVSLGLRLRTRLVTA